MIHLAYRERMTQFMFDTFSGEPGRFVSVCFASRVGFRDGLWRQFVAHSSHPQSAAKPLALFVEAYGTEMGSFFGPRRHECSQIEFECRPGAEVPRDGCFSTSRTP